MQSRRAAFSLIRRLALQDIPGAGSFVQRWNKPTSRLLHYSATRPLRSINSPLQGQANKAEIPRPKSKPQRTVYDPAAAYKMTFTCKPCGTRSSHRITKQGYHNGSVLIACPECKNRHVISDHLGIFMDKAMTIEDLMRDKGQLVKKGTLGEGEDGDVEFWEDGTTTAFQPDEVFEKDNGA